MFTFYFFFLKHFLSRTPKQTTSCRIQTYLLSTSIYNPFSTWPHFLNPRFSSFIYETCIRLHINVGVEIVNERRRRRRRRRSHPLPWRRRFITYKLAKAQFARWRDTRKCTTFTSLFHLYVRLLRVCGRVI